MKRRSDALAYADDEVTDKQSARNDQPPKSPEAQRRSVLWYIITLFAVVIIFISVSYFISQRSSDRIDILNSEKVTALERAGALQLEADSLQEEIAALTNELELRDARITELEGELQAETDALRSSIDTLMREYSELEDKYSELLEANAESGENEE